MEEAERDDHEAHTNNAWYVASIGADGGGARGGRLPLEAKIDGPPPREKQAPPSPRRTGPP